jgi:hypothetical protein
LPISFRSKISSTVANQTFVDKTIDDVKRGKLGLFKNLISEPKAITDIQEYIHEIVDTVGISGEGDPDRRNYSSTNYVQNSNSRKRAIERLDDLVFTDITAINNKIAAGSIRLKSYESDAAFEAENGVGVPGNVYYHEASGLVRYYDGIEDGWKDLGKEIIGVQESIGQGDGVQTDFSILNLPLSDESIIVFINGVAVEKSRYSFSSPLISFNSAPSLGQSIYVFYMSHGAPASPVVAAGTQVVLYHSLTGAEIAAKQLSLPSAPPNPLVVMVDYVEAGAPLVYGESFTISGNILSWDSLLLDGIIEESERLRIFYFN